MPPRSRGFSKYQVLVTDPDGWDRENFDASWNEEITEDEFKARLLRSTSLVMPRAELALPRADHSPLSLAQPPAAPLCEECDRPMHEFAADGYAGWACDGCGWSFDTAAPAGAKAW